MSNLKMLGPEILSVTEYAGDPAQIAHVVTMDIKKLSLWDPDVEVGPGDKPKPDPANHPTPYDFRTSSFGRPGDWVRVIVNLHDKRATFRPDDFFLTAGDRTSQGLLQRGKAPRPDQVEFFVLRKTDPQYVQYNLGLFVRPRGTSGYELPIYIDPKIENGGGKSDL